VDNADEDDIESSNGEENNEGQNDGIEVTGKSDVEDYVNKAKSGYKKTTKEKKVFVPVFVPEKEKKKSEYNRRVITDR